MLPQPGPSCILKAFSVIVKLQFSRRFVYSSSVSGGVMYDVLTPARGEIGEESILSSIDSIY